MIEKVQPITKARRQRILRNELQWRELVAKFERGNLSVREFCERHELTPSSLHAWRKRLREAPSPAFVILEPPVADTPLVEQSPWDVELSLGGRITLRLRQS